VEQNTTGNNHAEKALERCQEHGRGRKKTKAPPLKEEKATSREMNKLGECVS